MGNARKILVVDDDSAVREKFEQALSGQGYAVSAAASGEEALWMLDEGQYDAVFTGVVLRGMSGLEVAQEIRALRAGLPVVIVTANDSEADQAGATAAGAAALLHQPVSPEQLAETAARVMKAAESLQPRTSASEIARARATNPFVSRLKNIGLFLLGPFISLFYLITFPVIGLVMLVYMALMARQQKSEKAEPSQAPKPAKSSILKSIATIIAMAAGGVVYGVFVPILGIGLVIWFGLQAWSKLGAKAMGPGQT